MILYGSYIEKKYPEIFYNFGRLYLPVAKDLLLKNLAVFSKKLNLLKLSILQLKKNYKKFNFRSNFIKLAENTQCVYIKNLHLTRNIHFPTFGACRPLASHIEMTIRFREYYQKENLVIILKSFSQLLKKKNFAQNNFERIKSYE